MRIAIASSYGLSGRGVERAFDEGARTFFWGALRHRDFGRGLAKIAQKGRENVEIATVTYARSPLLLRASVELARLRLGVDSIDLLVLGYVSQPPNLRLVDSLLSLRERALVRSLGVSSHDRTLLVSLAREDWADALMVRYSAAHPAAETELFPHTQHKRVITYTATRWGTLLDPARAPVGVRVPRAVDCYRFALSSPDVSLVLAGPANEVELQAALAASRLGPLSPEEQAWIRAVGAHVRATATSPEPRRKTLQNAVGALTSLLTRGVTEDVVSRFNR